MTDRPEALTLARYTVLANPRSTLNLPQVEEVGPLRSVGCFMAIDERKQVVAFRADDAPDLTPEFRMFTDGDCNVEVATVAPGNDGAWTVQLGGETLGRLVPERRALRAPAWRIEGGDGREVARLDDSGFAAAWRRRWRRARYRESWRIEPTGGGAPVFLLRDPSAAAYVLRVVGPDELPFDRALVLAAAMCIPTLEGLTGFLRPDFKRFEG